jgi:energy-coupling factor transporter ATP-binding protein EcfA2
MMALHRTEDIAVVGSPSSTTQLTLDVLQEATEERLVGALTAFEATQNGQPIVSVGQIVGIELKNRWHEDSVFRNLVKRTGEIPPITNRQDTRTAELVVGATFCRAQTGYEPDVLGMVPPTGTRVCRIDQTVLDELLEVYKDEITYLGHAYANDVMYPMWFKHFGSGPGGAGEAYHLGVFGKTGSGKSGLAKMMLGLYAQHTQMGILVIDPQGEFSLELAGKRVGKQGLPLDRIVLSSGRQILRFGISEIQLDDWQTFEGMLVTLGFCEELTITHPGNAERAAESIALGLQRLKVHLDSLTDLEACRSALSILQDAQILQYVFPSKDARDRLSNRLTDILTNRLQVVYETKWRPVAALFSPGHSKRRLISIVNYLMGSAKLKGARPVVIIDLSEEGNKGKESFWSEELERKLLSKLLQVLVGQASRSLTTDESANILVLLDEAHRHAPSGRLEEGSEAERLRGLLRRAVRETRKYGLGWFCVSQTLGGLDREIILQMRILAFGFGLAMGSEFDVLRDFVGGDRRSLELYQSFRDPQSFPRPDLKEFPFMAVGPLSPLAFSGKPIFFNAFTDPAEFARANGIRLGEPRAADPLPPVVAEALE